MTSRIVVGVDGSKEARNALVWAVEEARLRGATLDVVHAYSSPWGYWDAPVPLVPLPEVDDFQRKLLDEEVAAVNTNNDVLIESVLLNDLPARALIERGKGADLLVVGSRGKGGFAGLLLGSVSQQVVHHAPCPVVVIPTPHG